MANKNKKNKKVITKVESSDEKLTIDKSALKAKKANKVKKNKVKNDKPRRNFAKEIISELKKVNWPSFGKACKQTGTVLVVVGVFMLAVLGIDSLVAWILSLITKI